MDAKTLKRANELADQIKEYSNLVFMLEDDETRIFISKGINNINLGCISNIKKSIRRYYKRKLAIAKREMETL